MNNSTRPIVYPEPTNATVKELYGTAFRCAKPDCHRPLFTVDNKTGKRTLNSNVAHIHARREGGPRWDPNQTPEENRSASNLLLLCLEHAFHIDQRENVDQFPPQVLRDWKEQQLAEFDRLQQGWVINNSEAEEAIRFSFDIANSVIDLGGKGGNAPGAGGGGGGVFGGSNSIGGNGGPGGNQIRLDGYDASAPGAGGGGGGVRGDGIAGNGGGGGQLVEVVIPADNVDTISFTIGTGGKSDHDGGDTIARVIKDGEVVSTLIAEGGKAPILKETQPFPRTLTPQERELGIGVTAFLLADVVYIKDSLLNIINGSWSTYPVQRFPQNVVWPLLIILSIYPIAIPSTIIVTLFIKYPDGNKIHISDLQFNKFDPAVFQFQHHDQILTEVVHPGVHTLELWSGNTLFASTHVNVLQA